MAPAETYHELYPAVAESVPRARVAVTEFAREAGAPDDRVEGIRLAVSEAVTNAVRHAYRTSAGAILVRSTGGTELRMGFMRRSRRGWGEDQLRGSRASAATPA